MSATIQAELEALIPPGTGVDYGIFTRRVENALARSRRQVKAGLRTPEQHAELVAGAKRARQACGGSRWSQTNGSQAYQDRASELHAELREAIEAERLPSEVTDVPWLFERSKGNSYPAHTERGGKWMVFVPMTAIDDTWSLIAMAVRTGALGSSAKTSTRMPNPNARSHVDGVICVYTYDGDDVQDVMRIREVLRALGVTWKIGWKADATTRAGLYTGSGGRMSRYWA